MTVAGIDIGSTACKAIIFRDGQIIGSALGPSTASPARSAEKVFAAAREDAGVRADEVVAVVGTGYGRALVPFADENVSELTCHGRGACFVQPRARTVLDIGGQDTKAILIDEEGFLLEYAMNDKCAAGTGRFLEAMARTLDLSLAEMDRQSVGAGRACVVTSMCSVFAESEIINLINEGVELGPIMRGLHEAMAGRVASLARRVGVQPPVIVTGGVAKSRGVMRALEDRLGIRLSPFDEALDPQLIGALGAAVTAAERQE